MKGRPYRPRRSLRIEIGQLAAALALPAAIFYTFPYKALAPSARVAAAAGPRRSACAFVTLGQDQERRILAASRSAWQISTEGVRRLRLDMFAEEIPAATLDPVADIAIRTRVARSAPLPDIPAVIPTDMRAPAPDSIAPAKGGGAPAMAFPKEEMLRLE